MAGASAGGYVRRYGYGTVQRYVQASTGQVMKWMSETETEMALCMCDAAVSRVRLLMWVGLCTQVVELGNWAPILKLSHGNPYVSYPEHGERQARH